MRQTSNMFYFYFRTFNRLSSVFGMRKPFVVSQKIPSIPLWSKLWSILIALCALIAHLFAINFKIEFYVKSHMYQLSNMNNLIVNIIIILNNICKEDAYRKLYNAFLNIFDVMKLSNKSQKMICHKLYILVSINGIIFIISIVLEIYFDNPPFIMLIRIPLFFAIFHLIVHLCMMLSILRFINYDMLAMLKSNTKDSVSIFLQTNKSPKNNLLYFIDPNIYFIDTEPKQKQFNLKIYCKIYDSLCTCILLLERCHGMEVSAALFILTY